jgi:PmbA protein
VLILSVLGLHTQDSVSGSYSLSAPHSLRIIKGQIAGKIDVKLTGNFFADMAASTTQAARSDFELYPYLMVSTGVQGL